MIKRTPSLSLKTKRSPIHGKGIFSTARIYKGQIICEDRIEHKHRGYNHSCNPNVLLVYLPFPDDQMTVAIRDIAKGEELTVSYLNSYYSKFIDCNCDKCRK